MEVSCFKSVDGWLIVCVGLNDPLRPYFSLYPAVSLREGERTSLMKCRGLCMVHVFQFTLSAANIKATPDKKPIKVTFRYFEVEFIPNF